MQTGRLLIYNISDRAGVVDDYIYHMLDELDKYVDKIVVVSEGTLRQEAKKKLAFYAEKILEYPRGGRMTEAIRAVAEAFGWDRLGYYKEIVWVRDTVMGPLVSLGPVFRQMEQKRADFWGISESFLREGAGEGENRNGYFPEYLDDYFLVFRKELVMSREFQDYWENERYDSGFTRKFANLGFEWDVYLDTKEYLDITYEPILTQAVSMIEKKGCPFFAMDAVVRDYTDALLESSGEEGRALVECLQRQNGFDMDLFWQHVLRVGNIADIQKNICANYILSGQTSNRKKEAGQLRIALVIHIYFPELVEECYQYAQSMPEYADVYITTDSEEKKKVIYEKFRHLNCGKLDIRVVPNCGRDVGPFLVETGTYFREYDLICHTHDKKAGQVRPGSIGLAFSDRCFHNSLKSKAFVENIIQTFEDHERLGILMPPPPNHSAYYFTLGKGWSVNFKVTKELADRLGLLVDLDETKEPVAPIGSTFWVRPKALEKLLGHEWKYENFPAEPLPWDGTVLHAVERIYGFCAQDAGYYPGWVLCREDAEREVFNLTQMLYTLNHEIFNKGQILDNIKETAKHLDKRFSMAEQSGRNATMSVATLFLGDADGSYSDKRAEHIARKWEDGNCTFAYTGLEKYDTVQELLFEPTVAKGIEVADFHVSIEDTDGNREEIPSEWITDHGIKLGEKDVFLDEKPGLTIHFQTERRLRNVWIECRIRYELSKESIEQIYSKCKEE